MVFEQAHWEFVTFDQLTKADIYLILKARADVFVVEQNAVYQDLDNLDFRSHHLIAWEAKDKRKIMAYARLVPAGLKYDELAVTRVMTAQPYRGHGLAKELMKRCLCEAELLYPKKNLRLSAQRYLEAFYTGLGFRTVSEPYTDTGIPHIDMLLKKG